MIRVKAVSASLNLMRHCGMEFSFTLKDLEDIAHQSENARVFYEWEKEKIGIIGNVFRADVINDMLFVDIGLDISVDVSNLYIVPGFCLNPDKEIRTVEYSLTSRPSDPTLQNLSID